ncbi:Isochorismatase hydrolase [Dothidotthia symphoricarpi CBS 119687]|uniref:Isochorismatase hydrolase n=1 Tax=Dothidotthia symphoricarpi CBS 119687 TaxID=1392245 RepID=A0A6A6AU98_9PLEO|nr:Isochorismatase hydrolase [Dothidotthia symphoricarpi CBS 119687]KAF2134783.1 Isochorismatase hydrolase [Dothidotthia symphoricarpi CBS 119687]
MSIFPKPSIDRARTPPPHNHVFSLYTFSNSLQVIIIIYTFPPKQRDGFTHTMTSQIPTSVPYAWPHDASLSPRTTALLIIDMQRDFLSIGGYLDSQGYSVTRFQSLIPVLVSLLSAFRCANFPIYHTREGHAPHLATVSSRELHRSSVNGAPIGSHGPLGKLLVRGQRGHDIIAELQPLSDEPIIDKPGRGAFTNTDLDLALRMRGIRNLVVCGVTADACVSSTVREASDRGYDVLVVEDGVESVSDELKKWSLEALKVEGGLFGVTGNYEAVKEAVESWMGKTTTNGMNGDKANGKESYDSRWYYEKKKGSDG